MSRHRNIRSMNYQDEYDGYDDVYGHSVEDSDYCVSPSTAQQYMFDRSGQHPLASYVTEEDIPEEDDSLSESSSSFTRPTLSEVDEARLNSCLEEIRNIIGESTPENVLVDAVIRNNFEYEKALNSILNTSETPKPQREHRRDRRPRALRNSSSEDKPISPLAREEPQVIPDVSTEQVPDIATNTGGRLTFAAEGVVRSGFTPEKVNAKQEEHTSDEVDMVKRDFTVHMGASTDVAEVNGTGDSGSDVAEGAESAADTVPVQLSTPRRGSSQLSTPKPKSKADILAAQKEYERRQASGKDCINLVVIGHVDAGKSTLMGHVLYQLGFVNKRTMHKYEQESKKLGKASFAYAWVLDETEEERSRGVTMDIAQTHFETDTKSVTLLDAPGHKDFIPNMITGAAQADVAILVVNAARGEFETGFETGGQTREHAMLIRSLGVSQLLVAVNKLDTVEWSQERFKEISKKLGTFLKQTGFKEADVTLVPCSGLTGQNLTQPPTEENLKTWYTGPTIIQGIDSLRPPGRAVDKPLRMCIGDVFKGMGSGISLSGMVQAGSIQPGDKVRIMPQGELCTVKSVLLDDSPEQYAFAGDNATIVVTGIDMTNVSIGSILCEPANPIPITSRIQARVVIFNIEVPLTKGFPVVFHYQSLSEPAHIRRLVSQLNKSTGEVVRSKPRCLTKNSNAVIEVEISRPVCIELYKDYRDLGRFMLRYAGSTIAAGLVTEIKDSKGSKAE